MGLVVKCASLSIRYRPHTPHVLCRMAALFVASKKLPVKFSCFLLVWSVQELFKFLMIISHLRNPISLNSYFSLAFSVVAFSLYFWQPVLVCS